MVLGPRAVPDPVYVNQAVFEAPYWQQCVSTRCRARFPQRHNHVPNTLDIVRSGTNNANGILPSVHAMLMHFRISSSR